MSFLFCSKVLDSLSLQPFCLLEECSRSWQLGIKWVTDNLFKLTDPVWLLCAKANICVERSKQQSENKVRFSDTSQPPQMENLSHPLLSLWQIQTHVCAQTYTYSHTDTQTHTHKDMLDPPACLCPHAIVFIRGYWLAAGQIFQPLAGELSNKADHFQQALGPPPPKWRPHFCSSLNCLSASAV